MEIRYRHNVMGVSSVAAFAGVRGGLNHGCRDVYFVRLLGANPALREELAGMDVKLGRAMEEKQLFYHRVKKLPSSMTPEEQSYYMKSFEDWQESGRERMIIRITEGNHEFQGVFGRAAAAVLGEFSRVKKGISVSIEKNFIMKICRWADYVMEGRLEWDERLCMKIIGENISKEQEYLFYYFLTLTGADVLLIQQKADVVLPGELKKLSQEVKLGDFVSWELPEFVCPSNGFTGDNKGSIAGRNTEKEKDVPPSAGSEKVVVHIPRRKRKTREDHSFSNDVSTAGGTVNVTDSVPGPARAAENYPRTTERREKSFEELALMASSIVMIAIHDRSGKITGSGSGIMIGRDGYILTNQHVVAGGSYFSVRVEDDNRAYQTDEIIKYHSVLDLAMIRIEKQLSPVPVFDGRTKLLRGQKVVAIGSPLGLFNSVSDGIISGFRKIDKVDMIQFTAPISHGSSGGAVLNMYGEVIGISTAGFDDGQNINLAVPYDQIRLFARGFCS